MHAAATYIIPMGLGHKVIQNKQVVNAREGVEKRELSYTFGGNVD